MATSATALSAQQLTQFLAVISTAPDATAAITAATELAAGALEAEVGAVLGADGSTTAIGFPRDDVPTGELAEVVQDRRRFLDVRGAGRCHTATAPIAGYLPGHLLVARSGPDHFTVDEVSLLRGMARVLELTVARLHTLEAERRRAAENERLLEELRERHRLLQELSKIQRAISGRRPLPSILDAITNGARKLLGDEVAELWLRDPHEPGMLLLQAHIGLSGEAAEQRWRVPIEQSNAAGQAVLRDDLVVSRHDAIGSDGRTAGDAARAAMAAPVHDDGKVVGSLVVASHRTRHYTDHDRDMLRVFADHVSMAVTDTKIREKISEAYHDSLTGLASRALFLERLRHRVARARRRLAVLFIDLDRFKLVNDCQGHAAGDALLVGVANRIRSCLHATETAARLGGDEFAVLVDDLGEEERAAHLAAQIIAEIQAPFLIQGREAVVSASIGIAYNADPDQLDEDLIRNADLAMYQAKKKGPGRYEVYQPAMQARVMRTLDLEVRMRRALEQDEFVLHYQPIVDLADGRIRAVEALLRWFQPDLGLIPPQQFIPLAEENGLIVPIGRWALREACAQVSAWNAALVTGAPLAVNVNLSARQLQQEDLPDTLAEILGETGLAPESLVLEITESLMLTDADTTMMRLAKVKALNVGLALDDFGTGYSSLAYLRRFPIDIIKIDKSFVAGIGRGSEHSTLTRAIVQLGQTLQLVTVAEGIENAEQMLELRNAGCVMGQGYHFAKPLDRRSMANLLTRSG